MQESTKNLLWASLGGLLAGTVGWFLIRPLVAQQMETQVRATLSREIPAQINATLDQKLAQLGITPATGQQIAQLLQTARTAGLIR